MPLGIGSRNKAVDSAFSSPLSIAGCVHWSVADDWDAVFGTLPDRSGHGTNWTQGVLASHPTLTTNGLQSGINALHFDAGKFLQNAALGDILQAAGGADIFLILKVDLDPPLAEVDCGLWTWDSSHPGITSYPYIDGHVYDFTFRSTVDGGYASYGAPPATPANPHMYEVVDVAGEWHSYMNDTSMFTMAGTNGPKFESTSYLGKGARTGGSYPTNFMKGSVAEMFVYDRKLSAPNRALISAYRSGKYGF